MKIHNDLEAWEDDLGGTFFGKEIKDSSGEEFCCYCQRKIGEESSFIRERLIQVTDGDRENNTYTWDFHLDCYDRAMKKLLDERKDRLGKIYGRIWCK